MRRFSILVLILLLLLLITSCNYNNNATHSSNINNTPSEYHILYKDRGLTYSDFDKIYSMCKSFLNEFYQATTSSSSMNVEPYLIKNNNLKKYTLQKIEAGSRASDNRIKKLFFGLKDIEWHLNEGYVFVEVTVNVEQAIGGFGETHQFLISNKDGKLLISDWYSKSAGSVSYLDANVRGNIDKIDDPNIWSNKKWVDSIFQIMDENK